MIAILIKKYALYLIMAVAIIILYFMYSEQKEAKNEYKDGYIGLQYEVKKYKDDLGRNVAKIEELELSQRTLRHLKDSTINEMIKENELMGVKLRQTESLLAIASETTDTILVPLIDTVLVYDAHVISKMGKFNDGYIDLKVGITTDIDSLVIDYKYRDNLLVSTYWERDKDKFILFRWMFPKNYYVAVKSLNPNTEIESLRKVNFKRNKK